jgi:glycosyltransferase involved in cell wall biosynthesis/O-antigen/teichoic acid export membrane protein
MEEEREHLARGVLVNLAGIIAKVSRPLYLILFSQILGVKSFGLYMLAFAIQETVSKFAILGLNWGSKRVVGHLKSTGRSDDIPHTVGRILLTTLAFSCFVAFLLFLSAPWIAASFFGQPELARLLRIFSLGMPPLCGMFVLTYSYRPSLDMRYELYVRSMIEPTSVLLLGAAMLFAGQGLDGVVAAHVVASLIGFAAALYFFFRIFPRRPGVSARTDWRMLFHSSLGMGGMEFLTNVKLRLDLFVLARFLSLTHVGIYSAIVEIASLLRKGRSAFDPILMPLTQKLLLEGEMNKLRDQLATSLRWSLQLGLGAFGIICLIPEPLLSLFGSDFVHGNAGLVLIVLAAGMFFHMSLGLLEGVLAITGFAYVTLVNMIVMMTVNFLLLILLVPTWGIIGAAVATTSSYVGVTVWRVFQSRRLLAVNPFDFSHLLTLLSWLAAMASALLLPFARSHAPGRLLPAAIFAVLYPALLVLARQRGIRRPSVGRTLVHAEGGTSPKKPDGERVKVLFLNSCVHGGGAGWSLAAILGIPDERLEASVIMPRPGVIAAHLKASQIHYVPEFVERIRRSPYDWPDKLGIPWAHVPSSLYALTVAACRILRLARNTRPDLIYCNHMLAKPLGTIVGAIAGIPVIFHSRGVHHLWIDGIFYSWLGARKSVKRIICNSKASARIYLRRSAAKVSIVPNSIDTDHFRRDAVAPLLRKEYGLPADTFVVGFVGRLHPKKGLEWLLESFASFARINDSALLALVGDTDGSLHFDAKERYRRVADRLGVAQRVIFCGFQEDVRPYLADFDILVFPSRLPESFGRVLIEAMALEVPVITSAHGGAVEVVDNGEEGLWVDVDDVAGLTAAMQEMSSSISRRREMGRRGRERVETLYSRRNVTREIADILVEAATDGR